MQAVLELVNHYGYFILFAALLVELLGAPLPGEFMMTYCGYLVYEGRLNFLASVLTAAAGVITGITISYFAGSKLGVEFFRKYGSNFHLGPEKLESTSCWFKSYGKRLLMVAYFIPGVRHITGYFSGITEISYKRFALNAYIGAFIWTSTFIFLGKALGPNWSKFHAELKRYSIILGIFIFLILVIMYSYKKHKAEVIEFAQRSLNKAVLILKSMRRIRAVIAALSAALMIFIVLLAGVIQDYMAHEFEKLDTIAAYLINAVFTRGWSDFMAAVGLLSSMKVLFPVALMTVLLVIKKNKYKYLEITFTISTVLGGEAVQYILRQLFRRSGPAALDLTGSIKYTFPSAAAFMSLTAYGFFTFLIIRHSKKVWFRSIAVILTVIICLFSGVSPIFFGSQYPSDIYAGYVFGGVWLIINIISLELNGMLSKMKTVLS
ncbi:MAG: bifunctional DedA family/phosphatase PAP2 family protein [Bacillota bacterium]|nr:bifunctional DedA family/phosphatase PAP2 family protein [Bacillota bacterium]